MLIYSEGSGGEQGPREEKRVRSLQKGWGSRSEASLRVLGNGFWGKQAQFEEGVTEGTPGKKEW